MGAWEGEDQKRSMQGKGIFTSFTFIASHLSDPLVHPSILLFKRFLEPLTGRKHGITLFPVCEAILKDLPHVLEKFVLIGVHPAIHLALDGTQVHRLLDPVEVVGNTILLRYDGLLEGADQSSPETWRQYKVSDSIGSSMV